MTMHGPNQADTRRSTNATHTFACRVPSHSLVNQVCVNNYEQSNQVIQQQVMGTRRAHLATAEPWAWGCPNAAFGTLSEHQTAKLRPLHTRSQCLFSSLAALGL
jgi:hypothetical protein